MQQWNFKVSGKVLIPGEKSDGLIIRPENFKNIIRISDYENKNMPTMLAHVNLDKNLFDKIIANAKTATMYLKIDKYDINQELETPTVESYIEDEFSIFVSNDINYYKELDYKEKDEGGKDKQDVYKEAYLGLMSKKCIDANKTVANTTMMDTHMMTILSSYMNNLHLLIEPFQYNRVQQQLIIPPTDTLVSLVSYLNSVEVFYPTKYQFFIDEPFCTYLLSKSGKGVPMKNERFNDVIFNIRETTDPNTANQGMNIDTERNHYYVDLSVTETAYKINHDVAKVINKFDAIINPSKDNSILSYDNIAKTKAYIDRIVEKFKTMIKKMIKKMGNVPEKLNHWNDMFKNNILNKAKELNEYQNKLTQTVMQQASGFPTSVPAKPGKVTINVPVVQSAFKSITSKFLGNGILGFNKQYERLNQMSQSFEKNIKKISPVFYDSEYLDNYLNSVTEINVQDVIEATKNSVSKINSSSYSASSHSQSKIFSQTDAFDGTMDKIGSIADKAIGFVNKIKPIYDRYSSVFTDSNTHTHFEDLFTNASKLMENVHEMQGYVNTVKGVVGSLKNITSFITGFAKNLLSFFPSFNDILSCDIKSKFVSLVTDVSAISFTGESIYNKLSAAGKYMASGGFMNQADLQLLKNNLDSVTDLTGIGQLGVGSFESDVNLGGSFGDGRLGTKIIVTKNDNPNEVKNHKSELENQINKLTVHKYDLDPSVFTPNKKYVVKNYAAHSDKDGLFLLNKKTEIYTREADNFRCITMMNFSKILEVPNNDKASDANKTTANDNNTTKQDWYSISNGKMDALNNNVSVVSSEGKGITTSKVSKKLFAKKELGTRSMSDMAQMIKR